MKRCIQILLFALGALALSAGVGSAATMSGPIFNPANGHSYFLLSIAEVVPEPSTYALFGLGVLAVVVGLFRGRSRRP